MFNFLISSCTPQRVLISFHFISFHFNKHINCTLLPIYRLFLVELFREFKFNLFSTVIILLAFLNELKFVEPIENGKNLKFPVNFVSFSKNCFELSHKNRFPLFFVSVQIKHRIEQVDSYCAYEFGSYLKWKFQQDLF